MSNNKKLDPAEVIAESVRIRTNSDENYTNRQLAEEIDASFNGIVTGSVEIREDIDMDAELFFVDAPVNDDSTKIGSSTRKAVPVVVSVENGLKFSVKAAVAFAALATFGLAGVVALVVRHLRAK